ncbi:hypothetical protein NKG05_13160 [Oerskovia sp. M15]
MDGKVTVRTSNGEITGTGLGAPRGRRRVVQRRDRPDAHRPQDVRATTDNGAVRLTVPAGSYRVSAETDNGSTDVSVRDDPDGEFHLDVSTSNGRVAVSQG